MGLNQVLSDQQGTGVNLDPIAGSDKSDRDGTFFIPPLVLRGIMRLMDGIPLSAAAALAYKIHPSADPIPQRAEILASCTAALLALWCLGYRQGRTLAAMRSPTAQAKAIAASLALGILVISVQLSYLEIPIREQLRWLLAWGVSAAGLLLASRGFQSWLVLKWFGAGHLTRKIAVVGADFPGLSCSLRAAADGINERIVGVYDDSPSRGPDLRYKLDGDIDDLLERCRRERIDTILITAKAGAHSRLGELQLRLSVTVSDIYLAANLVGLRPGGDNIVKVANEPALLLQRRPVQGWDAICKRCFDAVLAACLVALLAPLLGLIAMIIKLDSPGPVLFRQPRLGFNNKLFDIYKFRTMHHHMTDLHSERQTQRNDERVTRVGKWLRRLSIDELPQLINVLRDEMSLVGPRPHALNTKAGKRRFTEAVDNYALRHRVKPGITGWAQVNGWRGETVTLDQIEQRVACDLHYIDNWNLFFDLKILLLTVLRGITSEQSY